MRSVDVIGSLRQHFGCGGGSSSVYLLQDLHGLGHGQETVREVGQEVRLLPSAALGPLCHVQVREGASQEVRSRLLLDVTTLDLSAERC